MVCIYCGNDTKVTNSRHQKRANRIWRRRRCITCGSTTTTVESLDYGASLGFRASKGALAPFQRDILFVSVLDSLRHRKTAISDATALTDTILKQLMACMDQSGAIDRDSLTTLVTEVLQRFDTAAGVQYAAFHPVGSTM